jgi:Spy/CpxP family protein refolding chaperone
MMYRLIVLLSLAGALIAQGPGGFGFPPGAAQPGTDLVKAYLSLTDSQIQGLQQFERQAANALQSTFQEIQQKQLTLQEQLDKGSTDAGALGKLLLDIESLRKRVSQTQENFRNQAVATLTAEQKTKLKTLEDAVKLQPAIGQAVGLLLLTPPQPATGGLGFGPLGGGRGRPGGGGPMRFGRPPRSDN